MKILVGLGNPGKEYEGTRHSVGKFILEKIAKGWDVELEEVGDFALVGKYGKGKNTAWLIFPAQFMNESGPTLKKILKELGLKPKVEDILVIHDELDILVGRVKITFAKSSAGHKGVESVIKTLKKSKFWRLRVGVYPQRKNKKNPKDFLLGKFSPAEQKLINKNTKKIIEGVEAWLENPDKGMNIINRK